MSSYIKEIDNASVINLYNNKKVVLLYQVIIINSKSGYADFRDYNL